MYSHTMGGMPRESILVILPGSTVSDAAIRALADISSLDLYQARTKLDAQFPLPVARVRAEIIDGQGGLELEKAGINFFAIDEISFDAPFEGFQVSRCEFGGGEIRFINEFGVSSAVGLHEKVFLAELRYKEEVRSKRLESKRIPLSTKASSIQSVTDHHKSTSIKQVLHLYVYGHQHPIVFVDDVINYSSLGAGVEANATWNFLRLKGTLEQVFEIQADRTLVDFSFAAQSVLTSEKIDRATSTRRENNVSTNIDSANKLSRVLYAAWLFGLRS